MENKRTATNRKDILWPLLTTACTQTVTSLMTKNLYGLVIPKYGNLKPINTAVVKSTKTLNFGKMPDHNKVLLTYRAPYHIYK